MAGPKAVVPIERIEKTILLIRGQKVILDSDLARIYGVATKVFNQAVKRNRERFPEDFMFQLTREEAERLQRSKSPMAAPNRSQIVTGSQKHRDPRFLPYAFTEHGAIMAATVLSSSIAVRASLQVVRTFVRLREMLATHKELASKLTDLERKLEGHDQAIQTLFDAIRQLLTAPEPKRRRIGFYTRERGVRYGH
jgi:hypothetical protein